MRSSYGLFGIVFEVTIRVRPTTLAERCATIRWASKNFRKYFPVYKARGYAVMYYIFPYVKRVLVELRKDNPDAEPVRATRWVYRNRFWRKYGPRRHVVDPAPRATTSPRCAPRPTICTSFSAPGARAWCAATAPGRTRRSSTIRASPAPTNTCSACGPSARAASSTSSRTIAISASPIDLPTRIRCRTYRCDLPSVGWEFLRHQSDFVGRVDLPDVFEALLRRLPAPGRPGQLGCSTPISAISSRRGHLWDRAAVGLSTPEVRR